MAKKRKSKKSVQKNYLEWVPTFPFQRKYSQGIIVILIFASLGLSLNVFADAASPGFKPKWTRDHKQRINTERADAGIKKMRHIECLNEAAEKWSRRMANRDRLYHSKVGTRVTKFCGDEWRAVGENVGRGSKSRQIWNAFKASPSHYSVLMNSRYNRFGTGAYRDADGTLYITHLFAECRGCGGVWDEYSTISLDDDSQVMPLDPVARIDSSIVELSDSYLN